LKVKKFAFPISNHDAIRHIKNITNEFYFYFFKRLKRLLK
jgi:hypothetical protein